MSLEAKRLRLALEGVVRGARARAHDVVAVFVSKAQLPLSGGPWYVVRAVVSRHSRGYRAKAPPVVFEAARAELSDEASALHAAIRFALEASLREADRTAFVAARAAKRARVARARAQAALEAHRRLAPEVEFFPPVDGDIPF
jgi:hypothetical protein